MQEQDESERVRRRLAHRLHDGPIQELTAAQLFLDGLALRMEAQQVDEALRESLDRGLGALRNATAGCRQLMDSLRPGLEGEGELAERVRRVTAEVSPDADVAVDLPSGFGRAQPTAALALYRTLEDTVDEARRARATLACVDLAARDGRAELSITLADAALDAAADGLQAARRRLAALGGRLEAADEGRVLRATLPTGAAEGP